MNESPNTAASAAPQVRYVGLGPRFLAFLVDSIVGLPLLVALRYELYQAGGSWMQMLWASRDNMVTLRGARRFYPGVLAYQIGHPGQNGRACYHRRRPKPAKTRTLAARGTRL